MIKPLPLGAIKNFVILRLCAAEKLLLSMTDSLEHWLGGRGATLDATPDVPRGLYERLKFVAAILAQAGGVTRDATLLYRKSDGKVDAATIRKPIEVGRELPSDVVIADSRLSHRHFRISPSAGIAWLEDLKSRNGTYVNGGKASRRRELLDGDVIEAGNQVFVFLKKFDTI